MFTPEDRAALLDRLIREAEDDDDVAGAALVGSHAAGTTDRWSDIDLALRVRPGLSVTDVAERWTGRVRGMTAVADTLDIWSGSALYRVLLLADTMQVDLSFWPHGDFRSTGEPFRLLFGSAQPSEAVVPFDRAAAIRWGWLLALHARSATARGKRWQALQMIDDLRQQLVALACVRHDLPPHQGRGADRLPREELAALQPVVPAGVDPRDLARALVAATERLEDEARRMDTEHGARLAPALRALRGTVVDPGALPSA